MSSKEYQKQWHQKNKDRRLPLIKARKDAHIAKMRWVVRHLKSEHPCKDCGIKYPYYVMDYDHVTENKDKAISKGVNSGWSLERILEELSKCELVCANCHRERTHQREIAKSGHKLLSSATHVTLAETD